MIDRDAIARQLDEELAQLETTARQLDEQALKRPVPNELWTVRDTLAHLIASEETMFAQAMAIADGKSPQGNPAFDQAAFNQQGIEKRSGKSVAELLDELRTNRQRTLAFLRERSDADLERWGKTASGRDRQAGELVGRIAAHQLEHLEQIKAAVGAVG